VAVRVCTWANQKAKRAIHKLSTMCVDYFPQLSYIYFRSVFVVDLPHAGPSQSYSFGYASSDGFCSVCVQ